MVTSSTGSLSPVRLRSLVANPAAIFTANGLVNGTALCVAAYTKPGDGVVLMTGETTAFVDPHPYA